MKEMISGRKWRLQGQIINLEIKKKVPEMEKRRQRKTGSRKRKESPGNPLKVIKEEPEETGVSLTLRGA